MKFADDTEFKNALKKHVRQRARAEAAAAKHAPEIQVLQEKLNAARSKAAKAYAAKMADCAEESDLLEYAKANEARLFNGGNKCEVEGGGVQRRKNPRSVVSEEDDAASLEITLDLIAREELPAGMVKTASSLDKKAIIKLFDDGEIGSGDLEKAELRIEQPTSLKIYTQSQGD